MRDSVCGTLMVFYVDRAQGIAKSKKSPPAEELSTLAKRRAALAPKSISSKKEFVFHPKIIGSYLNHAMTNVNVELLGDCVISYSSTGDRDAVREPWS